MPYIAGRRLYLGDQQLEVGEEVPDAEAAIPNLSAYLAHRHILWVDTLPEATTPEDLTTHLNDTGAMRSTASHRPGPPLDTAGAALPTLPGDVSATHDSAPHLSAPPPRPQPHRAGALQRARPTR